MLKQKMVLIQNFFIILLLVVSSNLLGDGCFFYEVEKIGNSVESPNQRALIIHNGEKEILILQVKYSGEIDKFAWIVPVPSLPSKNSISTANDSIFKELHDYTQPRVYKIRNNYGLDRTGKGENSNFDEISNNKVQVWQKLQIGPYKVAVLSGSSSQALVDWLTSNGYNFPDKANPVIDFYIKKNWYFIATRVQIKSTISKSNSTYQAGLPALEITFQTQKPVFPLQISQLTSAKENEIELYVAAPHRMVCENYNTTSMDRNEVQRLIEKQINNSKQGSSLGITCDCKRLMEPGYNKSEFDYEAIFRSKLFFFKEPTFVVEYAEKYTTSNVNYYFSDNLNSYLNKIFSPQSQFWLTRIRTILPRNDMQDDVTFIPDPKGDKWLRLNIYIEEKNNYPLFGSTFGFLGIALLLKLYYKIKKRLSFLHWKQVTKI